MPSVAVAWASELRAQCIPAFIVTGGINLKEAVLCIRMLKHLWRKLPIMYPFGAVCMQIQRAQASQMSALAALQDPLQEGQVSAGKGAAGKRGLTACL